MTLEQFFFASQIAAAAGVIASLIFVGIQVRDGARATRSATAQAVHENYAGWYLALAANTDALNTSSKGFVSLEAQGHLADDLWACWEALVMNLVNTPGGAAFCVERSYVSGEEFGAEVSSLMAREPHPAAKAFGVMPVVHRTVTGNS